MELLIGVYWSLAFTVILSFLGGLTFFIQRQNLTEKFQLDSMNQQQQGRRSSGGSRRKNARNANRKKQQTTTANNLKENQEHNEENSILPEDEQESSVRQTDEEHQQLEDVIQREQDINPRTHIENEQEPILPLKQRNKNKPININTLPPLKEEPVFQSKPQASVAPVKQTSPSPLMKIPSAGSFKSSYTQQDNYPKSIGNTVSYNMYTYSGHNPLPPRFQQQRQNEAAAANQKHRRRKGAVPPKRSSLPPGSAARPNDFVPSSFIQQQQQLNNNQLESSVNNDDSSESDILSDSTSTAGNNSFSPLLSTSAGSQASLRGLDLIRSITTSHGLLEELISIFDIVSFSSDELELIMNKVAAKHILNKQDLQRLRASTKPDKTIEQILDETCRSQVKILAIELQSEKNRVLELTKSNAEMDSTIRQLQQQQQPTSMAHYQQMVLPFQIQLRRLADENTRLQHQLHAYSMMPGSINELKQQINILDEQLRQMTIKNNALENEVADSERGSKHAAEIYKKADAQKQERIEQMIADINKYKKLDKELTTLRQKHQDLEKDFNSKIDDLTHQRDDFQAHCDQFKEKAQQYDQLQMKYNQLVEFNATNGYQQELNDLKAKNDELRQRNWKIMQELNKLSSEEQDNPKTRSS